MRLPWIVTLLLLAGCTDDAPDAPADLPDGDGPALPATASAWIHNETLAWPDVPTGAVRTTFDVSQNATLLEVRFNWRGDQPGGYSSNRAAYLIDPAGGEEAILDGDLPINPYACANSLCGPADPRVRFIEGPLEGTWAIELRGAYTGTAYIAVKLTTPA